MKYRNAYGDHKNGPDKAAEIKTSGTHTPEDCVAYARVFHTLELWVQSQCHPVGSFAVTSGSD